MPRIDSTIRGLLKAVTRPARTARAITSSFTYPVGQTPREKVWRLNKCVLYRYKPVRPAAERHPVPLLLVFAAINRPFLFDMRPGFSFIEFMLEQGFDVYLFDWGEFGPEDGDMTLDDYGAEYVPRAVRRVLRDSGAKEVSVLGYCMGAIIVLLYAALNIDGPMRNMILLTTPLDMSEREGSKFVTWLDKRWFDVDKVTGGLDGVLPTMAIENGGKMLKVAANYVGAYVNLWDRIDNPESVANWQAMHRWVHDGVPLPAGAFRQWVRDYLWDNALVSGKHTVKGQRVDLGKITVPTLNILAKYDHIVPVAQSMAVGELLGSKDITTEVLNAGHIGIMAGRKSKGELWPKLAAWLGERSGLDARNAHSGARAEPVKRAARKKTADKTASSKKSIAREKATDQKVPPKKTTAPNKATDQKVPPKKTTARKEATDQKAPRKKSAVKKKVARKTTATKKKASRKKASRKK
ncbi:MAG: alpha/beta fold hydrolase [Woeseiaceae bacterium]|nr:alpha/beta fold hydrolase [Woeseiaceae bacterium]